MRIKIRYVILAMIAAFVLAPMLLANFLLTKRAGEAIMQGIKLDVQDTAAQVADDVAEYMDRGEMIVRFLAQAPALRMAADERIGSVLEAIVKPFPFTVHACYVRPSGSAVRRPAAGPEPSAGELMKSMWYKMAMEQGRLVWTPAHAAVESGRPIIAAAAPVRTAKGPAGVVALEFDLESLSEFLRRFRLEKRGTIFVVDENDRLVSSRRPEWLLKPVAEAMPIISAEELRTKATTITARPRGLTTAREPRRPPPNRQRPGAPPSGPRVISWAPIERPSWHVGVMVPLSEYYGMLSALRNLGLAVTAFAFTCALALGIVLGHTIVHPIGTLVEGTRRIASGQYEHRVEVGGGKELRELAEAFNSMAEQLDAQRQQERLALIGRMASGVIHDLRTPMAVIKGALPLLLRPETPEEQKRQFADMVNGAVGRMAEMTQDILEYARGDLAEPKLEPVPVRDFVDALAEALRQEFELSGMTLRAEVECDVTMRADRERLARAFYNIADNARDAMGERGTFSILATSLDHRVRFVLADTGPGIPDEMRDHVFEPFVTGKHHGTGLGLAIAREIVQAHGGEIRAESEPGEGARFVIDLPAEN